MDHLLSKEKECKERKFLFGFGRLRSIPESIFEN